MKIYYINANCGDGSSRTEFYDSQECIDFLTDDDRFLEEYMDGDGGSWGSFEAPGGITGVTVGNILDLITEYGTE